MDLVMTIRMEQDVVFHPIVSTIDSPNNVVIIPTRLLGDFLVTDGTDAALGEPQAPEGIPSLQGVGGPLTYVSPTATSLAK